MNKKPKFLLKDQLFNKQKIVTIAAQIKAVYPNFKTSSFINETVSKFPELELKARIVWIAVCLKKYLPANYRKAVSVLISSLPKPNNPNLSDNDFGDFIYASYAEFIARFGNNQKDLNLSLKALREVTMRFSAEDAIRYFINSSPKPTLNTLFKWSKDKNYHVRRLCSEGTRPKLPWSQKINIAISDPLPILDRLFNDPTRYVTRSVANHINDIAKLNPNLAIVTIQRWQKSGQQQKSEMDFITAHALRGLVKQGNEQALKLLGFSDQKNVKLIKFVAPKKAALNGSLNFELQLKASQETAVLIDYVIYFQNKAGQLNSKKVFKLTKLKLKKGQLTAITKQHKLTQFMTTRTLYPGLHAIELQINGKIVVRQEFKLS